MSKVFDLNKITIKSIVDQSLLDVYNKTKSTDTNFLFDEMMKEISQYKVIIPLPKTRFNKELKVFEDTEQINFAGAFSTQERMNLRDTIQRIVDYSIIPKTNPFIHIENNDKFVQAALKVLPNINAYTAGKSLTNLRSFIQNIYYNLNHPGLEAQQKSLYLYSALGGTGKSEFIKRLRVFLDSKNLSYTTVKPVGRWLGSEYSKSLVGFSDEWMPPRNYDRDITISKLNNIIDNVEYEVEYKGHNRYQTKSTASLVFSSNFKPFDTNDRRYGIVEFNEIPYESISKDDKKQYFPERTQEEWNEIFNDLFESCPFNKVYEDIECKNSESLNDLIWMAREMIVHFHNSVTFSSERCTIREIVYNYYNWKDIYRVDVKAIKEKIYSIRACVRKAVAQGLIKPVIKVNGSTDYSKYDLYQISKLETSEDKISNPLDDVENTFEKTKYAFVRFLEDKNFLDTSTKDYADAKNDTELISKTTNDFSALSLKLSNKNEFVDKFTYNVDKQDIIGFTKPVLKNNLQELVCVNRPLNTNSSELSRKNVAVEQDCFLLEIDAQQEDREVFELEHPDLKFKGSKEEKDSVDRAIKQYMIPFYREFKDNLKWICSSGRLSVHMVLKTNIPKDKINPELRSYVFNKINETFFNNTLDTHCKNASRLARNPNAIRKDTGKKQIALLINEDCKAMDVSNWIKEYYAIKEIKDKAINAIAKLNYINDSECSIQTLERIVTKTQHPSGLLALQLVKGEPVASGSNLIGAIGYMKGLEKSNSDWYLITQQVIEEACSQHPTNIHRKS